MTDQLPFSEKVLPKLLQDISPKLPMLQDIYKRIPATRCLRKTNCCSLLPETALIETLAALRQLSDMPSPARKQVISKIVCYFFLNPVEITACPFLVERDCLIYENRFFGCRAYGLWSQSHYNKIAAQNQLAKRNLHRQWEKIGIFLPGKVLDFHVPYCPDVKILDDKHINDESLAAVSDNIETLSCNFTDQSKSFHQLYFSDLSFLLTSLALGFSETIRMKFNLVKDIITSGNRTRLNRIVEDFPDILQEL